MNLIKEPDLEQERVRIRTLRTHVPGWGRVHGHVPRPLRDPDRARSLWSNSGVPHRIRWKSRPRLCHAGQVQQHNCYTTEGASEARATERGQADHPAEARLPAARVAQLSSSGFGWHHQCGEIWPDDQVDSSARLRKGKVAQVGPSVLHRRPVDLGDRFAHDVQWNRWEAVLFAGLRLQCDLRSAALMDLLSPTCAV